MGNYGELWEISGKLWDLPEIPEIVWILENSSNSKNLSEIIGFSRKYKMFVLGDSRKFKKFYEFLEILGILGNYILFLFWNYGNSMIFQRF